MKRKQLLMMLLLALVVPLAALAQVECELTVNNGTDMYERVPAYGGRRCNQWYRNEFIIDKAYLQEMAGKEIIRMNIAVAVPVPSSYIGNQGSYSVRIREVQYATGYNNDNPSFFINPNTTLDHQEVNGVADVNGKTSIFVRFNTPFLYSGEHNLVVQFQSDKHNWTTSPFGIDNLPLYYGVNQTGCALEYCDEVQETTYLDNGWLHPNNAVRNFAPKVTFTYRDEPKWANTNKPQNPVATVLSTSSIKLEWEAGDYTGSTYQVLCVERGTTPNWDNAVSVSSTTYTFENLASNTTYDLYVRARKVSIITYTSNAASATATTQRSGNLDQGPLAFGFNEGTHPNGLTVACNDSHLVTYNGSLYYSGEGNVTITLPQLTYTNATNGLMLEFSLYQYQNSQNPVEVELVDENQNETLLSQSLTVNDGSYQHFSFRLKDEVDVSLSPIHNRYIIRFTATGSFSLDNINVRKLDNIIPAYDLAATDITTTLATISWTDDNVNTHSLELYYKQKGATAWNSPITESGTSYTLTNLSPYTQYEVMVKTIVGSNYENSATLTFATQCPAMQTPYTMDFTGLTELPQYWKIERGPQNVSINYEIDDQGISFGSVISNSQYNRDAYIIMPYFENLSSLQLSLEMISIYNYDYYTSYRYIEVGVMSDPFDVSTFEHISDNGCSSTTVPETINVNLNTNLQHGHIAIKLKSGYVRLDNFVVTRAAAPTNLEALTTNNSATLSWTSTATEWQVRYKATSDSDWGSAITVTEPTCTITGLTANTEYTAQVRAKYGDGLYSTWEDGDFGTFKTLMQAPVVINAENASYYEDFESDSHGWILNNGGSTNYWCRSFGAGVLQQMMPQNGNKSIYITDGTTTGTSVGQRPAWKYTKMNENQLQNIARPSLVYLTKIFNLSAGQYTFNFDYKVMGNEGEDYLRVFLLPADMELNGAGSSIFPDGYENWYYLDNGSQVAQTPSNNSPSSAFVSFSGGTNLHNVVEVIPGGAIEPGNYMMVFAWRNTGTNSGLTNNPVQYPAAIDNVSVTWSPVIYEPSMSLQGTTDTEASLSIVAPTSGITPTSYEVQYMPESDYINNNNNYDGAPIVAFAANDNPLLATLTDLTPNTGYCARVRSVFTANGHSVYSDWADYASMFTTKCPRPTNLVLVDQTTSWARTMWTPVEMELPEGQSVNYSWQLTTDLNDWGAENPGLASNSWSRNLTPGEYHFRVRTDIYEYPSSIVGTSDWSEPIAFTIAPWAESVTFFPVTYGFEEPLNRFADGITLSGDFDKFGFYHYENQQDQLPAHAGGESQYLLAYTSGSNSEACLVLPAMAPSSGSTNLLVGFWWYHDNAETNSNVGVTIEYSSDNGSTWQAAGDKITRFANETGWVKYQQRIFVYTKTYIRLRFTGAASQQWWTRCYLDDLNVAVFKSYTPYIAEVTCNGTTANITLYDYALEHDLYSTKVEVQYREYREPGQTEEKWTTYEPEFDLEAPYTFENHLTVDGLYPYTAYEFRARAKASMPMPDGYGNYTVNWSDYSEPYIEWTGCGTYTISPSRSYSENFENATTVECWTGDIDNETGWHLTTDEAHSGTKSFYIDHSVTGTTNLKELLTPQIDLTQLYALTDNVVLRFWVKYTSTSNHATMVPTSSVNVYNGSSTVYQLCQIPLNTDGWTQIELSLSKQMGNVVTVGFKTASRSHVIWYIDDIEIVANPYPGVKICDLGGYNYASQWNYADSWYPNGVPTASDDVMILEGSPSIPDASYNRQVKSIVIGHGGDLYSPTVASSLNVIEGVETHSCRYNPRGVPNNALSIGATTTFTAQSVTIASECPMQVTGTANITTLNPGSANSVIVNDGGVLNATTITGTNGGANNKVVIKSGGQVKTENAFYGTIEKDITGYGAENVNGKAGWYLVATPTLVTVEHTFVPQSGSDYLFDQMDFYWFNGSADLEWVNAKCAMEDGCPGPNENTIPQGQISAVLGQPKKGYLYARQNDGTVQMTAGPVGNMPFPATNVDSDVQLSFTSNSTATFNGWNLIGNPFTCDAYVKRGNSYLSFYKMNETGDRIVLAEAGTPIKPCEGVFVQCNEDVNTHTATFTSTEPSLNNSMTFSLHKPNETKGGVSTGSTTAAVDRTRIQFGEGHNLGHLDLMADPNRLYIPMKDKAMAVVNCQPVGEMPLNFEVATNGTYTLSFENDTEGLTYCHLIDNKTGADVDLLQQSEYTFDAKVSDYASRFKVVFVSNEDGASTSSATFAFNSNGNWIIANEGRATLQVVDLNGRILSSEQIEGCAETHINAVPGLYLIRLINGENVKVQKVVVR